MVRRGPETVIERVQSQRGGKREKEQDTEKEIGDEIFLSPLEMDEPLTPATTKDSEYKRDDVQDLKMTPPTKTSMFGH